MQGIKEIKLADLLSSVKFERQVELHDISSVAQNIRQMRVDDQYIYRDFLQFEGNELSFTLGRVHTLSNEIRLSIATHSIVNLIKKLVTTDNNQADDLAVAEMRLALKDLKGEQSAVAFADTIAEEWRRTVKPTKDGTTTPKRYMQAVYAVLLRRELPQAFLKNLGNAIKNSSRPLYLYSTTANIENHYSLLAKATNSTSCMVKGSNEYNHTKHWLKADKELAEQAGYIGSGSDEEYTVFTAPVEGYNHSSTLKLGLLSYVPPDEIASQTKYPFFVRAILHKADDYWGFTRAYGHESAERLLNAFQCIRQVAMVEGARVRAYLIENENMPPSYVLPYLDGDSDYYLIDTSVAHTDSIGRTYFEAKSTSISRDNCRPYMIDKYPKKDRLNIFCVSQRTWIGTPPPLDIKCEISNSYIQLSDGWYDVKNDRIIHYQLRDLELPQDLLQRLYKAGMLRLAGKTQLEERVEVMTTDISRLQNSLRMQYEQYNSLYLGSFNLNSYDIRAITNSRHEQEFRHKFGFNAFYHDDHTLFRNNVPMPIVVSYMYQVKRLYAYLNYKLQTTGKEFCRSTFVFKLVFEEIVARNSIAVESDAIQWISDCQKILDKIQEERGEVVAEDLELFKQLLA